MTMIGLLLNPTKADFSPEGLLPHESAMQPSARTRTSPVASPLVPPARLKRLLDGWIAAAIAYRERQVAWLALHRAGGRNKAAGSVRRPAFLQSGAADEARRGDQGVDHER